MAFQLHELDDFSQRLEALERGKASKKELDALAHEFLRALREMTVAIDGVARQLPRELNP